MGSPVTDKCEQLAEFARELAAAERDAVPIAPLSERDASLTVADAYAIQLINQRRRTEQGYRLSGHKIGLTSGAMREMLGVGEPDFGYLTSDLICSAGCRLSFLGLIAPMVEPEIAFRLGRPLAGDGVTLEHVLDATEAFAPALEVIDSRIADWRITLIDTVADNASCACAVLGTFRPAGGVDVAEVRVEQRLVPLRDRRVETVSGEARAVLGHPGEAVAWLARALHRYGGGGLDAGQVILPGAMTRAVPVSAGDRVEATFSGLGDVSVTFEAG